MLTGILFALILLFVYPFAVYPVVLALWAKTRRRFAPTTGSRGTPSVALVICALNEQGIIRQKIENSLALDYPEDKLTIVVVSDGSTDSTTDIVREYAGKRVVLIERQTRLGKIANLNAVIPSRTEDIIVLSDANVIYHPSAVGYLVAAFDDPSVGCVSGKVILTDTTPDLDASTQHYYSIEWSLQKHASDIYSTAGADGAMYAIRRELFRACPNDTLIEDFVIPMQVIAQGRRVLLQPRAVGWEKGVESLREEFRRKVRIAAGAAQGMLRGNVWPQNAPASFWFIFLSHKLLRWLSPYVGALVVGTALACTTEPLAQAALAGFAVLCVLAIIKIGTGLNSSVVSAPFYFLFGQVAVAVGLLKGLTGQQTVLWAKANR